MEFETKEGVKEERSGRRRRRKKKSEKEVEEKRWEKKSFNDKIYSFVVSPNQNPGSLKKRFLGLAHTWSLPCHSNWIHIAYSSLPFGEHHHTHLLFVSWTNETERITFNKLGVTYHRSEQKALSEFQCIALPPSLAPIYFFLLLSLCCSLNMHSSHMQDPVHDTTSSMDPTNSV